ncbi:hypothetical protein D1641_00550 [Colidextribacter sp. OB.20]|uniref:hypothetical protein n=1 Tax=Colidextribacter sp. OB.20 TaxID=2304568 RepID=UPI001371291C|nr:hypothetical protein [Colidextribacter sp. OB.20]NBI08510.1 hypothetical protein [Colidextribacter sp. OB.20]
MSLQQELLELETAANQVSRIINAIDLMSIGLDQEDDSHADGFFAVCDYLIQADRALREQVSRCMKAL